MEYDASLLREFAVEAREHLEFVEDNLLRLAIQKDNPDRELIDRVFRSIHSIKGGAGFLSLKQMAKLAHAMEALLSEFRAADRVIGNESIDTLIAGIDLIQLMLEDMERSNDVNIASVHERLLNLLEHKEDEQPRENLISCSYPPPLPPSEAEFKIDPESLNNLPNSHEFLYLLKYDLYALWEIEKRTPVQLIKELMGLGIIADARIETCGTDLYEGIPKPPLIYTVLYSTILDKEIIGFASGLPDGQILAIDKEKFLKHQEIVINLDLPLAPEISAQYVSESEELLDRLEHCLCNLPEKPENMSEAFRMIHSFKGNSGLLGFSDFERLSHQIETVLDEIRSGNVAFNDSVKNPLLQGIDALKYGISQLSKTGISGVPNCDQIIKNLDLSSEDLGLIKDQCSLPAQSSPLSPQSSSSHSQRHDIRVDLEKLDSLINLVGELVIAESMVARNADVAIQNANGQILEPMLHNLRRIISDLQDVALSMRMVPLSRTFRKMHRLVHDLSLKSGKQVRLDLIGEETEVDKTVIEHITDPLVHIIRNSLDHGIELPEERRAKGKPEAGQILIRAGHEGGEVVIQVSDDGYGLNRQKILKKALSMGIVSGDGSQMTDDAVWRLIFEPGFSTAKEVTDVSGRGVGMDVVRRNLEKLKGRIDIYTMPDKGTTLTFKLPLTLAIIEGMLIRVGASCYTIPLLSIRETFRPKPEQITLMSDGHEIVKIRNDLIPVLRLHEFYKITPKITELKSGILIHVASGVKNLCLFADDIVGHHHTVIKGIPEYIASAKGLSGFTILDSGEVSLILDVGGIIDVLERLDKYERQRL